MDRLRKAVYAALTKAVEPAIVHYGQGAPPEGAAYPYVVFTLPNEVDAHRAWRPTVVEVNIWDAFRDGYNAVQAVEDLATAIDTELAGSTLLGDDTGFWVTNIGRNRIPVPDDTNMVRIELRYLCRAFYLTRE